MENPLYHAISMDISRPPGGGSRSGLQNRKPAPPVPVRLPPFHTHEKRIKKTFILL
jgi:hypothetical protein